MLGGMPVLSIVLFATIIGTLIDIILRDESQVKHLPKVVWILLVVFLPLAGIILWFALGREYNAGSRPVRVRPSGRSNSAPPPAGSAPSTGGFDTRSTEQQLADLEREIEEDRRRAELERPKPEEG
jgi:hypothetical protein